MGRNTIQLEDAVSTISQEYLQEFALEYYILKSLHPELPGLEDNIVDFTEGKIGVYTKFFEFANYCIPISQFLFDILEMDLFNLINAPNPLKVKIEARPRFSHKVPLLTATATHVINMENTPTTSVSSETPPVIVKSPLDFSNKELLQLLTEGDETETQVPAAVSSEVPRAENLATMEVVPELNLEKEAASMGPPLNKRRHKRDKGEADANAPPKILRKYHASVHPHPSTVAVLQSVASQTRYPMHSRSRSLSRILLSKSSKTAAAAEDSDSEKSISFTSMGGPPEDIYQPGFEQEAKLLKKAVARVAKQDQRIQAREVEITNLEALLEAEAYMKKAAEAKNAELSKELDSLHIQLSDLQFKKYEDERVTSRCAEMDARLDALSIDFDEELYPHMLTAIAVSVGIAKGMSEGLKHGVEHGKAKLDLADVEAYDSEADDKFTTALQALKDLEYPLVDQLERLKDAPIDLIMASLHLESDTGEDAPQFIHDLRPSSSQLKIPMYPEKKKSRVVCRTHGVGSAHHARSDGVPVSVPTISPQGLNIVLVDATTQTEVYEDKGSSRLLRFKSLPLMFSLEWS
ncbi:hypothetical protein Tco_0727098 [Tanacetum coccineum]|uniref:Transposase (Putative), gypsy type n=1 Tax=Tanacetum coccineum TaxID=301880 RepID=A0ABQ4YJX6_9ASTR